MESRSHRYWRKQSLISRSYSSRTGASRRPGAQDLFHLLTEILVVLKGLVVRVHVGVPGDAEGGGLIHRVGGEDGGQLPEENFLGADTAQAAAGQQHHLRQGGGQGDHREDLLLPRRSQAPTWTTLFCRWGKG